MKKIILGLLLFFSITLSAQETRDYLSQNNTYKHGIELYNNGHFSAAYEAFDGYMRTQENSQYINLPEAYINAQLFRALSARMAGRGHGIELISTFLEDHPEHPNTALARLELGKYHFENRDFNEAIYHLDRVDIDALSAEQKQDYNLSMGYTSFVKKRFQQALKYLQPVQNSGSQYATPATYYAGLSHYFLENYDKALTNLHKVKDDQNYSPAIPFYVSKIYFGQGEYDKLLAYAEPKLQEDIRFKPEIAHLLGQAYFNKEEYNKALPYLEAYASSGSKMTPEALYQIAYTQYQMRDYQNAIGNFEKLNVLNSALGHNAMYALAESYLRVNEKQKARNAFGKAANMEQLPQLQETAAFTYAKLSYELGFDSEALDLLQAFNQKYPNSDYKRESDEMLVDLLVTSNNYKDAYRLLQSMGNRSSKLNEAFQKVAYYRGVEVYNAGQIGNSKEYFDAVRAYPINKNFVALADYWTGETAYEYGHNDIAVGYIDKYIASGSDRSLLNEAYYTKGYAFYNQKEYTKAITNFNKVTGDKPFANDAKLRAADSYFALRQFNQALQLYTTVSASNIEGADYASFQKAVLNGLQGNNAVKLSQLRNLFTNKPSSAYADDALYEYGRVYTTQEQYSQATNAFEDLISKYPKSDRLKNAYLELGLINYNQNNYSEALKYYDKVVRQYPGTEEADAALKSIKEIYIETGRPEEYVRYIKQVKNVDLSNAEEEQLLYSAAETQFQSGNCQQALSGFSNYLNKYPRGIYKANAHFYRGECLTQQSQNDKAIQDYMAVADMPTNKFTERSVIRLARNSMRTQQYQEAIGYYNKLGNNEKYKEEITRSLMIAYERSGQRSTAYTYANQAAYGSLNQQEKVIKDFLLAHQKWSGGNRDSAVLDFQNIAARTRNVYGAEARYYIAENHYNKRNYTASIDACYKLADETPGEDYWVAKSFILIADNYYAQGELFQAKATLQSVIDNYKGEDLKQVAQQKLRKIEQEEQSKSNLILNAPSDRLQLDDSNN